YYGANATSTLSDLRPCLQRKGEMPCDGPQKTLTPPSDTELGGKTLENKQEPENLAGQMRHVEAVIKMLDPSYSLRAISVKRRQPNPWFKRGTVYRRAVDVMRTAAGPLTAREIAERVLVAANVAKPDAEAVR